MNLVRKGLAVVAAIFIVAVITAWISGGELATLVSRPVPPEITPAGPSAGTVSFAQAGDASVPRVQETLVHEGRAGPKAPVVAQPVEDALVSRLATGELARVPGSPIVEPPATALPPPESDRRRGIVTVQGRFAYQLVRESMPPVRGSVTVAASMDCTNGSGSFYYRDATRQVEWQSSKFSFDPASVCLTDAHDLATLVNEFNAAISATYSPLRGSHVADEESIGKVVVRFVSTDAAGARLPNVRFCLLIEGGAYDG